MPVRLPAIGSIAAHLEVHAVKRKPRCDAESHGQKVRHIVRVAKKTPTAVNYPLVHHVSAGDCQ